jgi:hypothetical protein
MQLALFSLIAWISIIVFYLTKKSLSKNKNIIIFFCINIIVINLFTVLTRNLKLIEKSTIPELTFCIMLQRNIIIPVNLLTYANLANSVSRFQRNVSAVFVFTALFSIEFLLKRLGIKEYTGWSYTASGITFILLIIITNLLVKLLNRISRRYA